MAVHWEVLVTSSGRKVLKTSSNGEVNGEEAAKLLEATLAEEKKTDELLTQLAERSVNAQAGEEDNGESTKSKAGAGSKRK